MGNISMTGHMDNDEDEIYPKGNSCVDSLMGQLANMDSLVGQLEGFSVSGLVQMLQNETINTLVEIKGHGLQQGTLFFKEGELHDASCGRLKGDEAALEMISWHKVSTNFLPSPTKTPKKTIKASSMALLMEGMRRRDERQAAAMPEVNIDAHEEPEEESPSEEVAQASGLQQLMKDISAEMDGVIAVGVVGMDGITVAAHNPTGIDMDIISAKFAMVMKLTERLAEDLDNLGDFEENLVQTAHSWILTRFLRKKFFLVCLVNRDSVLGNVRLVAQKYLERVQNFLL